MEMTGERRIPAPRQQVWEALNDPQVLQASIPGCESVERVGDDQFQAKVALKLGPMSAKFGGKVKLANAEVIGDSLVIGRIAIGADVNIGSSCVIGADAVLGDHAELLDLTAIPARTRVAPGERELGEQLGRAGRQGGADVH